VLAALVWHLTSTSSACLLVPDAHRRLGLVDVLSPAPPARIRLDDEVVLLDLDLDGVGSGRMATVAARCGMRP